MKIVLLQYETDSDGIVISEELIYRNRRALLKCGEWAVVNNSPIKDWNTVRATYAVTHIPTGLKCVEFSNADHAKEAALDLCSTPGIPPSPEIPDEVLRYPDWVTKDEYADYRDILHEWVVTYIRPIVSEKWHENMYS